MKNITIAGRVTKNAENRRTQNGDNITGFSVAVDDGFGQNKSTIFFDCSMFGNRGEKLSGMLTKGTPVTVSGDFSTREYNGKTYMQVRVSDVTLQGGKRRDDQGSYDRGSSHDASGGYGAGGRPSDPDDGDTIPF